MAEQRQPAMSPEIIHRRALSIARVLVFKPGTFAGRDKQAYYIMSHLAAMLSVDRGRRHAYSDELLRNTNTLTPDSQP